MQGREVEVLVVAFLHTKDKSYAGQTEVWMQSLIQLTFLRLYARSQSIHAAQVKHSHRQMAKTTFPGLSVM